jgi:Bacteriophage Mu Gam like protein
MPTEIAQGEEFHVRDASTANWVVRKIVEARQYAQRVKAWAEIEQRRAQREEQFLLRRFGIELEAWARQQIARQHDDRRSVSLPAGSVGFRTEPTRLAIVDEQRLLVWCQTNLPSAIRVIESVPKTPLMDHITVTGEVPDGAEIQGGGERFHITAKNLGIDKGARDEPAEEEAEG